MNFSCIVFGITFIAAGIIFAIGKWHIHLSAWKNMTEEEKSEINIIPLCRNIGAVIMLGGVIFLLKAFIPAFAGKLFIVFMILWLIGAGCDLAYITKSKRYQNNK